MLMKSNMRKYLLFAVFGVLVLSMAFFLFSQLSKQEKSMNYDELASNIVSGGPGKDGIPPIDEPGYYGVSEADAFLEPEDVVFVADYGNAVRIYPQRILVWHEVVNDVVNGERVSVTYCPLTGSVIGYKGYIPKLGMETTFGTSGKLLNSNLVLYDRETDSYIPQIFGVAVTGKLKGEKLESFPVIWSKWKLAKEKYPDALVLSPETGFKRDYSKDPYGSYVDKLGYYYSEAIFFPLLNRDSRLPAKQVVIGIRAFKTKVAIIKEKIRAEKVINLDIDGNPVVVIYDASLDDARVFSRKNGSNVLEFRFENGKIVDNHNNAWSPEGESSIGKLKQIESFDVMFFAWAAFFPDTEIIK